MKLSVLASGSSVITRVECINGMAFDKASAWVKCALAHVVTGGIAPSQDNCALFLPCWMPLAP